MGVPLVYKKSYANDINALISQVKKLQSDITANTKSETTTEIILLLDAMAKHLVTVRDSYDAIKK